MDYSLINLRLFNRNEMNEAGGNQYRTAVYFFLVFSRWIYQGW